MSKRAKDIIHVAISVPINHLFDYLPPVADDAILTPGIRVSVPFRQHTDRIGIIVAISQQTDHPREKLKPINHCIDETPIFNTQSLKLLMWASQYYHHPIGEVLFTALPKRLKQGKPEFANTKMAWHITELGKNIKTEDLSRSPKQATLLAYMRQHQSATTEDINRHAKNASRILPIMEQKQWIEKIQVHAPALQIHPNKLSLNQEQQKAITSIRENINHHQIYLLDGITGSGKTEVYLALIETVLLEQKQALVLLPEISLTPQNIKRFQERFDCPIAVQHSHLSDKQHCLNWQNARSGDAKIILGTRSAAWAGLKHPGIYIIDEEHDPSYKQQSGFHYSARDVLIMRAKRDNLPIILGSATPSLESLRNAHEKRYQHLMLTNRAGKAQLPKFHLIDLKNQRMQGALSQTLIKQIKIHLNNKQQVLLFLNRRGYAAHLYCHLCSWKASCARCDRPYTYHKASGMLRCHYCDNSQTAYLNCTQCNAPLLLIGHGTERIEELLHELFPDATVARLDRDTIKTKTTMSELYDKINNGNIDILVGTQLLAKGHHFSKVTLAAIVDADRGLFSTDFKASERLAQLFIQVSGRTGRSDLPGLVMIQTHHPKHPMFHQLITEGYRKYAHALLTERHAAMLPPYTYMGLFTVEAPNLEHVNKFIEIAKQKLIAFKQNKLTIIGPIPAILQKLDNHHRMQLLLQTEKRSVLHEYLDIWLNQLSKIKKSNTLRWSLDIDPYEMV